MTREVHRPCLWPKLTAVAHAAACAIACAVATPLPAKAQAEAQLQTIVITASNRAQPIADVQAAVQVISQQELQRYAGTSSPKP